MVRGLKFIEKQYNDLFSYVLIYYNFQAIGSRTSFGFRATLTPTLFSRWDESSDIEIYPKHPVLKFDLSSNLGSQGSGGSPSVWDSWNLTESRGSARLCAYVNTFYSKFCHRSGVARSEGRGQGQRNKLCLAEAMSMWILPFKRFDKIYIATTLKIVWNNILMLDRINNLQSP